MTKYVITDPGYILSDTEWSECCKYLPYTSTNWSRFYNAVKEFLIQYTDNSHATAASTGYGDWSNTISSFNKTQAKILNSDFCADSGSVCICEYNEEVEKRLSEYDTNGHVFAIVDVDNDNIKLEIDESNSSWSIVRIYDLNTNDVIVESYDDSKYVENLLFEDRDDDPCIDLLGN